MNGRSYSVPSKCFIRGDCDFTALAEDLRGFLTPAPESVIIEWLAELSVITARRQGDEFEEALRLTAYASRLARYPADVARYACLERRWHFWPSWAELDDACNALTVERRFIIAAIEREPAEREQRALEDERRRQVEADQARERERQQAAIEQDQRTAEERKADRAKERERSAVLVARLFPAVARRHADMAASNEALVRAQCDLMADDPDAINKHPEVFR